MSSSFPLIYTPFKLNNEYFLDGGIKENFNINLFIEYKGWKIGFNIVKKLKQQFEYINNVHVINIPIKVKTFNFRLTKEEIIELLKTGYDVTNKWIEMYFLGNNIVKKQRVFNE